MQCLQTILVFTYGWSALLVYGSIIRKGRTSVVIDSHGKPYDASPEPVTFEEMPNLVEHDNYPNRSRVLVDTNGEPKDLPFWEEGADGATAAVGDQVDGESKIAELQNAAESHRALLTQRTGRSCQYCLCTVTSIAQCGVDTVTSAALCGTKTITSIAQCGSSLTKVCYTRRRRRWQNQYELTCSTNTVAKSCSVPNTCDVAKSCDVSQPFVDCLQSLGSSLGSDGQQAVKYITDTSCSSLNSCKDKVTQGLSAVTKMMYDAFLSSGENFATGLVGDRTGYLNQVKTKGISTARAALDVAQPIISTFKGFVGWASNEFGPYNVGRLCSPSDSGFWYNTPTDCGLFSAMSGTWTPLNALSKFSSAKNALSACFQKKGLLGVPTPFWELKFEGWCMPDEVTTGIEYFLGATVYEGSSEDAAAASTVAQELRTAIKAVKGVIENFASSSGIGLLEIGESMHQQRATGKNTSLTEGAAASSSSCGLENNWGIELELCFGVSLTYGGATSSFNLCIAILSGCKERSAVLPNILFKIEAGGGGTSSAAAAEGTVGLTLYFYDSYPTFTNRVAYGARLDITPSVDLNFLGIPLGVGTTISFGIYPSPSRPSQFAFGVEPKVGADALAQLGREVHSIADESSRQADAAGGNGFFAGVAAAMHYIGQNEHHLQTHLAALSTPQHRAHAKMMAAHIDKQRIHVEQSALEKAIHGVDPLDITVKSIVGFTFCMTPIQCFGQ
eukprot:TRINITY_DN10207_c0_g1_i1.p1 TRINITY_DN10207_c0_g1~~TRINITY_DN10207_c0_g1_i1.p1  ORF type:complete len:730 (-),score=96.71 TRINITY_DN10207_c0_g1_i1:62-2251(-)